MLPVLNQSEKTWFVMKRWRVEKASYTKLCLFLLVVSLFFERYFFITTVYKMKYYGYVLILMVIGLTCLLNMVIFRMRQEKQIARLHELFNIERAPETNNCVIALIGMLDMLYAFLLFWPANVIPVWMLLVLLQLFIPCELFLRNVCIGLKHYPTHWIAGLIILAAVCISLLNLTLTMYQAP